MAITIAGYEFEGPFSFAGTNFKEIPAVYVILNGPIVDPVDTGETDKLRSRLQNHERENCWHNNCPEGIYVAVKVEGNQDNRLRLERLVRYSYDLPCGEE